jgi:outer membrane immunogenic protein
MTKKLLLLAMAALLLRAAPASAQSAADWSGPYIGVHGGGAWGNTHTRDLDQYDLVANDHWSHDANGFVGGAHLGYNALLENFLVGIEGDLGYLGGRLGTTDIATFNRSGASTRGGIYFTARPLRRGRQYWLVYGTTGSSATTYATRRRHLRHGLVWPRNDQGDSEFDRLDRWRRPEVPILPSVTLRGEYLFFDLGDETVRGTFGSTVYRFATSTDGQMVRVGLTWRFFGLRS